MKHNIVPFLWFDTEAEAAAEFYTSVFENSRILTVDRYSDAAPSRAGTVMTVEFELDGERFVALNGGPQYRFTEAVSFMITAETAGRWCPRECSSCSGIRTGSARAGRWRQ